MRLRCTFGGGSIVPDIAVLNGIPLLLMAGLHKFEISQIGQLKFFPQNSVPIGSFVKLASVLSRDKASLACRS